MVLWATMVGMRFMCLSIVVLLAGMAHADAIDVALTARALKGRGDGPHITVRILEPIAGFRVELKRSDGAPFSIKGGGGPGDERKIRLPHPEGTFEWEGGITVRFPNATESFMPLAFKTELYGELRMTVDPKEVDWEKRSLVVRLSRPADRAEVQVLMDTGHMAFDGVITFDGAAANSALVVTWPETPGKVMQVDIKAYDTMTFFAAVKLLPWRVDIPHEEVQFDTGQAVLKGDQLPKVEASVALIQDAVKKYGHLAKLRLYVAGHTDSVGAAATNRALALKRAQSLATYFKSQNLGIAVLYEGFGEDAPLVETADEVDEPKNRRAEYIISIQDPLIHHGIQTKWKTR